MWLALVGLALLAAAVAGADPTPLATQPAEAVLASGDLRSEGSGPGLVGNPLLILVGVVSLGLATALVTAIAVRFARRA